MDLDLIPRSLPLPCPPCCLLYGVFPRVLPLFDILWWPEWTSLISRRRWPNIQAIAPPRLLIIINRRSQRSDRSIYTDPFFVTLFTLHLIRQEHPEDKIPIMIRFTPTKIISKEVVRIESAVEEDLAIPRMISAHAFSQTIRISVELLADSQLLPPWIFLNPPAAAVTVFLLPIYCCVWFRLYSIQVAKHSIFVKLLLLLLL